MELEVRMPGDLSDEGVALEYKTGQGGRPVWNGDEEVDTFELIPKNKYALKAIRALGMTNEHACNAGRLIRESKRSFSDAKLERRRARRRSCTMRRPSRTRRPSKTWCLPRSPRSRKWQASS